MVVHVPSRRQCGGTFHVARGFAGHPTTLPMAVKFKTSWRPPWPMSPGQADEDGPEHPPMTCGFGTAVS